MSRAANGTLRRDFDARRLAVVLGLLFLALALPSAVLILQAQRQIKWEAYHQYRLLADELATRVDGELQRAIGVEEARAAGDYRFLVVTSGVANTTALQRSPLARFPVQSALPGAIGYFQVEADGSFSTPLLPERDAATAAVDIDPAEWSARRTLRNDLLDVLTRNALVARDRAVAANEGAPTQPEAGEKGLVDALSGLSSAAGSGQAQQAFDELNAPQARANVASQRQKLGRLEELELDTTYQQANPEPKAFAQAQIAQQKDAAAFDNRLRGKRKEQSAVFEDNVGADAPAPARVRIFESEVDPFEFTLLDSGHGVFYRKVWRDGRRIIQGLVVDQAQFLDGALAAPFRATPLAPMSDQLVVYRGDVLSVAGAASVATVGSGVAAEAAPAGEPATVATGELLHQVRLSAPLGDFQLLWSINDLPAGPGARVVAWSSLVLFAVLVLGLLALYRLGRRQLVLAQQQRDFVSAVSHELRTPLTSIRMYAEMLREGWVGEEKRREYYGFIHDESERLSRLIANVLQLARLERSGLDLEKKPVAVATLVDTLRSKLATQIERAGFAATFSVESTVSEPGCAAREVVVDIDAIVQIVINLVDNALKFSAKAERKAVDVTVRARGANAVELGVRDYGPGVAKAEMRRIFELFYRTGSELTRETLGTGIGLALVRQLAQAMGGEVDVVNREPGAEFVVTLPVVPRM